MMSTLRLLLVVAMMLRGGNAYTPVNHHPSSNSRAASTGTSTSGGHHHHTSSATRNTRSPSSQSSPPMIAQKMLKTVGAEQERGRGRRRSHWRLSNSVLAGCDTLPSFPTAHGILSPETVSRMDETTNGGRGNQAVSTFLKTYRQHGPMSCLEMLSDPEILPHLTNAMRDIAL